MVQYRNSYVTRKVQSLESDYTGLHLGSSNARIIPSKLLNSLYTSASSYEERQITYYFWQRDLNEILWKHLDSRWSYFLDTIILR